MSDECILLGHGSGGGMSRELVADLFLKYFDSPLLLPLEDSAVFIASGDRFAFTTDSYVVSPIFFPGADIGKLAICGTINDLSVMGAKPLYLSLALIIEEGFPMADLERILDSIHKITEETGVSIVTGDTKVVNHDSADKLFINTAGLGLVSPGVNVSGANARPGDKIILSGSIGDHGVAVMAQRENLRFKIPVESDCAPLNGLAAEILKFRESIHCMRDPTRGGLATTLNEIAAQSQVSIRIFEDQVPVKNAVRAACEMLGLDPLHVANEGKCVAIVPADRADAVLAAMRARPEGEGASIIGRVVAEHPAMVTIRTIVGSERIVDMLIGEQLPRIC